MRVSTNQTYISGVQLMQDVQTSLNDIQKQVSTGIALSQPSDDPIAFSQALKLGEEVAINDQFGDNIRAATGRNELADSMMGSAISVLQRMRELSIQAANDSLNVEDRAGIGEEVRILQQELVGIMNATDGGGDFIFGGFQGGSVPFIERNGGGYDYVGDEGQQVVQISPSTYVDVSDSGKAIFVGIASAENTVITRAGAGNSVEGAAVVSVGQVFDQAALDAVFPDKFMIEFGDPADHQNRQTYTVRRVSDGLPVVGTSPAGSLEDVTYIPGESIDFHGVRVKVSGNPQPDDTFFIESSGHQSAMNTVERLALALEDLAITPVALEGSASLIGRAAPARPTLTSAGNYVAEQQLTLTGDDGTVQTVNVASNASVGTVATDLDTLAGITATFDNAQATLDFTSTAADQGDIIRFNLNGVALQATAGETLAATYSNIDTALGAVLPAGGVSYSNNGDGTFAVTENTGENIAIDQFEVVELPGFELDVSAGLTAGEAIELTLTGSSGEVVNVSYTAVAGGVDELTTQVQAAITAAGHGASMSIAQPSAGQPAVVRYSGDTDGDAQIVLSNLSDNATDNIVLTLNPLTGTQATDGITGGAITTLRAGASVNIAAQDQHVTMGVKGSIGNAVTLRDEGNDSTAVAATLNYTASKGYELTSNKLDRHGGLISAPTLEDTVTLQFREAINTGIANLDNALNNMTRARSEVGARLNMLENSKDLNEGMSVELQDLLSRIRDLDYAQALTDVQMKTFVLQAAQNTFVKTTGLSLFNFIR